MGGEPIRILVERPPLWDLIDAEFHVAGKPVIFCWGSTIYNPTGISVSHDLQAHERIHSVRQKGDPEGWWRKYIADKQFRYDEEVPAHRAEYRAFCQRNKDKNVRIKALRAIAERLASPLYGSLVSVEEAMKVVDS